MEYWKVYTLLPALLIAGALPAAQQAQVVTIQGQALVDAPFDISIRPETASPCGTYFSTTPPPNGCGRVVLVTAGDTGAQVATKMANSINNWLPCTSLGYSASAVGNQVFISGPASFDLAVNAFDEMGTCAGAPDNLPFDGLWLTSCIINNLGNGIDCDEAAAHTGGLQLSALEASAVPALPAWAFATLLTGMIALCLANVHRGRRHRLQEQR